MKFLRRAWELYKRLERYPNCFVRGLMLLPMLGFAFIAIIAGVGLVWLLDTYPLLVIGVAIGILYFSIVVGYARRWNEKPRSSKSRGSRARSDRGRALELARENRVLTAMRRANSFRNSIQFIIVDIGVLVYEHENDHPHIVRHQPLPLDAAFLRPFLQIWTPERQTVDVAFELFDEDENPHFRDHNGHNLRGHTGVMCESWLPMEGISVTERENWSLRAYIDDMLMADHHLEWGTFRWLDLKSESPTDGELSKRLTDALKSGQIDTIGLDELLGYEPQKIGRGAP